MRTFLFLACLPLAAQAIVQRTNCPRVLTPGTIVAAESVANVGNYPIIILACYKLDPTQFSITDNHDGSTPVVSIIGGTSGGTGASQLSQLLDFKGTPTSSVLTIGASNGSFKVNSLPVVVSFPEATITKVAGTDSGTFSIYLDYNAGSPLLRVGCSAGINEGNYTFTHVVGTSCSIFDGFPEKSVPLFTIDIAVGVFQTVVDFRSIFMSPGA